MRFRTTVFFILILIFIPRYVASQHQSSPASIANPHQPISVPADSSSLPQPIAVSADSSSLPQPIVIAPDSAVATPSISISARRIDYGIVKLHTPSIKEVRLTTVSRDTIVVDSITVSTPSVLSVTNTLPAFVKAGDTLIVTIAYNPRTYGSLTDTVRIYHTTGRTTGRTIGTTTKSTTTSGTATGTTTGPAAGTKSTTTSGTATGTTTKSTTTSGTAVGSTPGGAADVDILLITGASPAPTPVLSADSIQYGDCLRGTSAIRSIIITNPSVNDLILDSIYTRTHSFRSAVARGILAQYDTLVVPVAFTAAAFRSYTDTLFLANRSAAQLLAVPLSGNSPVPILGLSAESVGFGKVRKNRYAAIPITLSNLSFNAIAIDSVTVPRGSAFSIAGRLPRILRTNDSVRTSIVFSPKGFGWYTDVVKIHSSAGVRTIIVNGESPLPSVLLSARALAYGDCLREAVTTRTIKLKNTSINALDIDTLYTHSEWFGISPARAAVPGVDSLLLTVSFLPDAFRTYADTLFAVTNSSRRIITIPLTGNSPVPVLLYSSRAVDFGKVKTMMPTFKSIMLSNKSLNTVTIDSIIIAPRSVFSLTNRAVVFLRSKDSVKSTLLFVPDSAQKYADTLRIYNNGAVPIIQILLTGEGDADTPGSQRHSVLPEKFSMKQNYPNPFNASTTIQFAVPKPSQVRIAVYDMTGKEVAQIFNGYVGAGYFSADWRAEGLTSGMYFYRITAAASEGGDSYRETKKLVIIK
jgi:hypothetical protein